MSSFFVFGDCGLFNLRSLWVTKLFITRLLFGNLPDMFSRRSFQIINHADSDEWAVFQVYQPNNQHHNQGYHKQQITPQQMYYHAQNSYTHHTQPNSVHFNQNRMQYSLPTIQQHHQQQSQQNPRQPHRPTPQQTGYYSSTQLGGTHAQYPYNNSNNHGGYNRPRKR